MDRQQQLADLEAQLPHALADASPLAQRLGLPRLYQGKVRDNFVLGNRRVLVVSDRISAFDRLLGVIPFKGEMLTQIARFWFEKTGARVPNHLLSTPDPQVMIARQAEAIPVEVVVRGRLTGSLWREYSAGAELGYGFSLPPGLKQYQAFAEPLLTPSTKADYGEHDLPISEAEIIARGLCSADEWARIRALALELFALGAAHAESRGLVLVDTKYEFGRAPDKNGKPEIIAIDEIHTPDSSRYWYRDDLDARLAQGQAPRMLDKEFLRGWLLERGFKGDGPAPEIPALVRAELAARYLELYEVLVGAPLQTHPGPTLPRVEANLRDAIA